jgi:hypothetical protein
LLSRASVAAAASGTSPSVTSSSCNRAVAPSRMPDSYRLGREPDEGRDFPQKAAAENAG